MQALRKTAIGYGYDGYALPDRRRAVPQPSPRREPVPRQKLYKKVQVKYVLHPAQRQKRKSAFLNCMTILLSFVLLSAVVTGYAQISSVNLENNAIQANIDELKAEVAELQLEISTKCDIQEVTEVAGKDLDMGFPESAQVEYVAFAQPVEEASTESEQEEGWFSVAWNSLVGLFK